MVGEHSYTIKFSYSTAKALKSGAIKAKSGSGEADIHSNNPLVDLETLKTNDTMIQMCAIALAQHNISNVISITINSITEKKRG